MLRSFKIGLVAVSLLVGGTALADRGKDGKRTGMGERRAKRMAKFDTNKDGKLDQTERAAMAKAKFDRLDKNRDGVLSFEEAQRVLNRGGFHKRGRGDDRRDHRPDQDE